MSLYALTQERLNRDAVRALAARAPRHQRLLSLCRVVAEEWGVTVEDIRQRTKGHSDACEARQRFMRLAYEAGLGSTPQIGRFLGGRDHTTVLHGIRRDRERAAE